MEIEYRVGDVLEHRSADGRPVVIAHVVNNKGVAGAGFAKALQLRFPSAIEFYWRWARSGTLNPPFELGNIQIIPTFPPDPIICNMLCQDGYGREPGKCYLNYAALGDCLQDLGVWCGEHAAEVAMPRIGAGLAQGEWTDIETLIEAYLCEYGIAVFVYTLEEGGEGNG